MAEGVIDIVNNDSLGTGDVTVAGPDNIRTLNYASTGLNIANNIILNNDVTLNSNSGISATQSGIISGSGAVTKTGDGILILTGINTYTGDTTITGGTLQNNGVLTSSDVHVKTGGTFNNFYNGAYYGIVKKNVFAEGGTAVNNYSIGGNASASEGGSFTNNNWIAGNASADGADTIFINNYQVGTDASASNSAQFDNNDWIVGNATATTGATFNNKKWVSGNASATAGGIFNNSFWIGGEASASGENSVFTNGNTIEGNASATDKGHFVNTFSIGGNAVASGGAIFDNKKWVSGNASATAGGIFNNSSWIGGDASASGENSVFTNGNTIEGNASATDKGHFVNTFSIGGNAVASGGATFDNNNWIAGDVTVLDAETVFTNTYVIGGTVSITDGIFTNNHGQLGTASMPGTGVSLNGSAMFNNYGINDVMFDGLINFDVNVADESTFNMRGGNIHLGAINLSDDAQLYTSGGNIDHGIHLSDQANAIVNPLYDDDGKEVTNPLYNGETATSTVDAGTSGVTNSGSGTFVLGGIHNSGSSNNAITTTLLGNIHQTGTGNIAIGSDIEGINNTVINIVDGDVIIENGKLLVGYGSNTVNNLDLGSNSGYQVLMTSDGVTLLNVENTAVISGDVSVVSSTSDYSFGQPQTILYADNSLTGQFSGIANSASFSPSLLLELSQDAQNVYLSLGTQFSTLPGTRNQKALAEYLDQLEDPGNLDDLLNRLVNATSDGTLSSLDNYTGDSYAAFGAQHYQNIRLFTDSINDQLRNEENMNAGKSTFSLHAKSTFEVNSQLVALRQNMKTPLMASHANGANGTMRNGGVWAAVHHAHSSTEADSVVGSPQWDASTTGYTVGYTAGGDSFRWGLAAGHQESDLAFPTRDASGEVAGYNAGLYGAWTRNSTYLNGILGYGNFNNEATRNVGPDVNRARFDSHSLSAYLELGKHLGDNQKGGFTPYASLLWAHSSRDGFSESGSGSGLTLDDASQNIVTTALGLRFNHRTFDKNGALKGGLQAGVAWLHQFGDTDFPATASIASMPGSGSFTVHGTPLSSNAVQVQLGAYGRIHGNLIGFAGYQGTFASNEKQHSVTAGLGYEF